jgi:transposase InsO family protein
MAPRRSSIRRPETVLQFTAIDDCTRIRGLKIYDACNQSAAIRFMDEVLRRLPFRVLVVQTNGGEFHSRFHWHLESHDIRHVYIRPRTRHLNGKVERSHRVDQQEFYQLLDRNGIAADIHLFNDKLCERTIAIAIDRMELSTVKPRTSAEWQNQLPVCRPSPETSHAKPLRAGGDESGHWELTIIL